MRNIPHLIIEFPDFFSEDFGSVISKGLESEMLDLKIKRVKPTAWAASEWIIPGMIAVYVLKPYFESFLKEAGKDHYILLKNKLSDILSKTKEIEVKTHVSPQTPNKIDKSNSQSKAISIFIQTKNNITIKLLYDNNLDLETWKNATHNLFDLIEDNYENATNNSLSEYLNSLDAGRHSTIYGIIDPESRDWTLINNLGSYTREQREKNKQ